MSDATSERWKLAHFITRKTEEIARGRIVGGSARTAVFEIKEAAEALLEFVGSETENDAP